MNGIRKRGRKGKNTEPLPISCRRIIITIAIHYPHPFLRWAVNQGHHRAPAIHCSPILHHHISAASTHISRIHISTCRGRIYHSVLILLLIKLFAEFLQHGFFGLLQSVCSSIRIFGEEAMILFFFQAALYA